MFYKGDNIGKQEMNLFKKNNSKNENQTLIFNGIKNNSTSPMKRAEQPVATSRGNSSNFVDLMSQTHRNGGNEYKYQNAQRVLDSQREKLNNNNNPIAKVDLNINQFFSKSQTSGILKNNNLNVLSKQKLPTGLTQLSNIKSNIDDEIHADTTTEIKETERLRKPSIPGERTLIKVNTPRESTQREEVKRTSNRTSSRIFDEIIENPTQKKENQKLELFNNMINNESMSNQEIKALIFNPLPKNFTFMCNLVRKNTGFDKISPKFYLFIEKNQKLLLAAKKRSGNTTSNFIITLEKDDFEKNSENTIGKLRSNFMGTEFNIFDKGNKPSESKNYSEVRQQYGAILYETNVFGMNGPRRMKVFIPEVKEGDDCKSIRPLSESEWLQNIWAANKKQNIKCFVNKTPVWCEKTKTFTLSFKGRVEKASVKNFQLIDESNKFDTDNVVLQFGRINDETFSLDFQWPFSIFQAFNIALSSLDNKLGCE